MSVEEGTPRGPSRPFAGLVSLFSYL